jgi:DNA polymerase III gamma/tau subunit
MTEPNHKNNDSQALHLKHRPRRFSDMVGQPHAVKLLKGFVKNNTIPRATLMVGPAGCGKTSAARILKEKLGCGDLDFTEQDCAQSGGVNDIRKIKDIMGLAPISGKCRVWLLDECGRLSVESQTALLKTLEDTPEHVYFMLATTDPQKLSDAFKTRCTLLSFGRIADRDIEILLKDVATKEKFALSNDVLKRITEAADGSARKALVYLNGCVNLDNDEDRLASIVPEEAKKGTDELTKELLFARKPNWEKIQNTLRSLKASGEDAEGLRRLILAGVATMALKPKSDTARYNLMVTAFEGDMYAGGWASLIRACLEVIGGLK